MEEGRDYTVENGLYVFTADFLRRRGYCCKSGCRNCPYAAGGELRRTRPAGRPEPLRIVRLEPGYTPTIPHYGYVKGKLAKGSTGGHPGSDRP